MKVGGICNFNSDINVTGTSYLNGTTVVTGGTTLQTSVLNDVCIVDSTGADTMRINDAGDITLHKAGVFFTTSILGNAGLYLNTLTSGPIAFFQANKNVAFYGTTLEARNIKATDGLQVTCGQNSLTVTADTTTISGGGFNCVALNAATIVVPFISPYLAGVLTLNGTNSTSKIVLGNGTVAMTGNTAITGTLTSSGLVTANAGLTVTGNTAITGTLTSSGLVTANAGLTVTGNVSMPNYLWAAGVISAAWVKLSSTGQTTWSLTRLGLGNYSISWATAHPARTLLYCAINRTGLQCVYSWICWTAYINIFPSFIISDWDYND